MRGPRQTHRTWRARWCGGGPTLLEIARFNINRGAQPARGLRRAKPDEGGHKGQRPADGGEIMRVLKGRPLCLGHGLQPLQAWERQPIMAYDEVLLETKREFG